jgi:hypothetical protein
MALTQLIVAWALLLALCYSAAIPSAASNSSNYFAITGTHTGIQGRNDPRPARRNILDLQNDSPSWSANPIFFRRVLFFFSSQIILSAALSLVRYQAQEFNRGSHQVIVHTGFEPISKR